MSEPGAECGDQSKARPQHPAQSAVAIHAEGQEREQDASPPDKDREDLLSHTNLCPIQKRTSSRWSHCEAAFVLTHMDGSVLGTREAADVSLSNRVTLNSLNKLLKGSFLYLAASIKHGI